MKIKNTLGDLHNHLFAEIERLSDEELCGADLKEEIQRAAAIAGVSSQIIDNAQTIIKAEKLKAGEFEEVEVPRLLTAGE